MGPPALRPLFRKMFPRLFSGGTTKEAGKYSTSSKCGDATGIGGTIHLNDMHRSNVQTDILGYSPDGSQEDIMRYNGILRTTLMSNTTMRFRWKEERRYTTREDDATANAEV
ncbi:hypothetical protein HYE67_006478 [Fusarium culmorum]|uniref:Uncharacterized protein n=1 Tax=Fusarium culmorum TaxID=5516 RepID=A0A2T4H1I9_FUSCU|nr:hypothetical protein FCULG_00007456 [Fusarium culmorum]QPC64247.1 hypothetical protein HYE67_006478 [Fusarium culmorum]